MHAQIFKCVPCKVEPVVFGDWIPNWVKPGCTVDVLSHSLQRVSIKPESGEEGARR